MIETEAKILLTEEDYVRVNSLLDFSEFIKQDNIIYPLKDGFLRIRSEGVETIFTYKGNSLDGKYNSREEFEVKVDGRENLEKILSRVGFSDSISYSKKRAKAEINNCVVYIDELDDSFYMEIEGSENNINKSMEYFGLSGREIERRSYQEIIFSE